jgi:hypothetical protein
MYRFTMFQSHPSIDKAKLNCQRQFLIRPMSLSRLALFKQTTQPFVLSKFEFSLLASVTLSRDFSREFSLKTMLELLLRNLVVFNYRSLSLSFFFLLTRPTSVSSWYLLASSSLTCSCSDSI